ncbi:hypothetical protein F2Q70_00001524 [Brassica cretica]|uniref:Pentatricopeptide repeat-containing protein n=1 Tax=Brassica cretica TaxID=69181 RepID=A0A8S9J0J4_BRACR|nr:hypothetical protein F2Q70_00001524 [Brassica cretica]
MNPGCYCLAGPTPRGGPLLRDLYFNGWIFCCLGFGKAGRHSSSAGQSWVFGNLTVRSSLLELKFGRDGCCRAKRVDDVIKLLHEMSTTGFFPEAITYSTLIHGLYQTIVELTVLQPKHPSSLVLSQQVFEEEPLDYSHQGPRLDTRNPMDEDLGPIFDEEDEPGPVFDEEATSITSIVMESHLCFDHDTTPAPLTPDLQEHS